MPATYHVTTIANYSYNVCMLTLAYYIVRMSASLQVILVWMLTTFASYSIPPVSCSHHDDGIIIINRAGVSSIECCVYGKCRCSNLSLALEHIQSNTDIRIMSTISLQDVVNDSYVTMETFKNLSDVYDVSPFVWLHKFILQFSHIITDCVNNLYGPAQVFMCSDDYSCDERYEYIVDSTHNYITMISNNTVASCPNDEVCTFQIAATANVNTAVVSIHINIKLSLSNGLVGSCEEDIAHSAFFCNRPNGSQKCCKLSCDLVNFMIPEGIKCESSGFRSYEYFIVTPGYWYSNGFTKYVSNCPQGHCDSTFDLYASIHYDNPFPTSNNQCSRHWTGLACGQCDNYIIHDSISCVPSRKCTLIDSYGLILFFFISLLYWIIVIPFIFVLLHFKFNITAGYAYGILFYYSVLELTVNASYAGTQNNLNNSIIITLLTILSSIGNTKPPFQLLKLCFWKNATMMDHMFLTYIHPVIVMSLIVAIFLSARNSVTVARTIGRYVNSKSICILLILSYSSVSYTSVQLLRPLAINNYNEYAYISGSWHSYLSPTIKYFDKYFVVYFIFAILCELIIGIAFPFVLAFQRYLTRYLNINFSSIKPVMDQLKGCYKEEFRSFAAYYLVCRQLLYAVDISTDFISGGKFPIMLIFYVLIVMVHVWFQPYKQRILNVLDSCILMTLMLAFIGEHASYGSTVVLWFFPLILFINCVAFSTKFKHLLIPISCLVIIALSCLVSLLPVLHFNNYNYFLSDTSFYYINLVVILPIASLIFLAYMVYLCVIGIKRCCKRRAQYKFINEHNEDIVLLASSRSCILYSSSL